MQTLITVAVVFSLLAAGVAYITMQNTNNIQASVDAIAKETHAMCLKEGACTEPAATPAAGK
jgi:hypothetical protein